MGRIYNMARNIEIKARAADLEALAGIAAGLADGPPVRLEQTDTFFHVPRGRLKLREFGDGTGELIQYARADSAGPKPSDFVRSPVPSPIRHSDRHGVRRGDRRNPCGAARGTIQGE